MSASSDETHKFTPDSDRLPEPLPVRRRGTRCACGASTGLKPYGRWGMICRSCAPASMVQGPYQPVERPAEFR